jgi:glycosyltransferase involved in cell wall biosynthesis
MKSADLFILPSAWEGLPNVLLEAQAIGLPVAATSVDGCIDALQSGTTGRLFPANNPNAIAQLIAEQIQNPHPAREIATFAQHQLQQTGSWEHCINRCHLLLQRLVNNPNDRADARNQSGRAQALR